MSVGMLCTRGYHTPGERGSSEWGDIPSAGAPPAWRGSRVPRVSRDGRGQDVPCLAGAAGPEPRGYVGGSERGGGRIPPRPAAACASLAGPLFAQGSQLPLAHAAAYKAEPEPAAGQRRRQRPAAPGPPSPPPPPPVPVRPPRPAGTMRAAALLLLALLPLRPLPGRAARPKLTLPIRPDTDPLPPGGAAGRSPLPYTLPSPAPRTPVPDKPLPRPRHPSRAGRPLPATRTPVLYRMPAPPSSGTPRSSPGPPAGRDRHWDRHRERSGRRGGAGRSGAAAGGCPRPGGDRGRRWVVVGSPQAAPSGDTSMLWRRRGTRTWGSPSG